MNAPAIISKAKTCGVILAVIDGELKGKNLNRLDDYTKAEIKEHKAEIINLLIDNESTARTKHKPENRQISCRAYGKFTKVLMATRTEDCIDEQGDYCGDCRLRQHA